ncbi:flagellar basal body rod protein FlgC [Algihabitans albus]|uniref:flagellar basal body rod protein FlgC n=1 Tax=Algihabitans albus TaxID=2164067 RepID=UPI000E5CC8FC|nr:flagellar basal body rod protein FlgC [Algihabitans albus]
MDLYKTLDISASGMRAQGTRLRVISENIANASSTGQTPGAEPFRRKMVTFTNELDRALDAELVKVKDVGVDESEFSRRYNPGHPAADGEGYVLMPNVNSLIEMSDMREAQRSYEANLRVIQSSRAMLEQTIAILR